MGTRNIQIALLLIRWATAGNMLIHGIFRLSTGGIIPFDGYLSSLGFPMYTAWAITFFEILAALAVIIGKWVTPLCMVFCLELIAGIILVHAPEGWFVVGGGRNGMEYSVLLIICFVSTAIANWKNRNSISKN